MRVTFISWGTIVSGLTVFSLRVVCAQVIYLRSLPPRDTEVSCTLVITISNSYMKGTTFSTISPVKEIPMPIRLTLALPVAHWFAALTLFQGSPGSPGPCCLTAHAKFGLVFPKATVVGLGPWRHCARESSSGAYTPPESSAKLIVSSVPHLHQ